METTEYKGFVVSVGIIHDGNTRYSGLIARRPGVRIEAPWHDRINYRGIRTAINQFTNK